MTFPTRGGAFLLSALSCILLSSSLATAAAGLQPAKRQILIGVINPPNGLTARVAVREGEAASMKRDDGSSFKLVPIIQKDDNKTVVLKVSDANSGQQIDELRLIVGGKPAQPKGLPFQLEIISVTTPK
jgi:hypothetical protein